MLKHIRRMFEIDSRANTVTLDALAEGDAEPLRLMNHVISAQRHYLLKMRSEEPERADEGDWSLARCREEASKVAEGWRAYLEQCSDTDLERTLEQRRSGEVFEIEAIDVLTHVITHSFHHRAQLNLLLRHAGRKPPRAGYAYLSRRKVSTNATKAPDATR